MKYDVLVQFNPETDQCELQDYIVADRFGQLNVLGNEAVGKC